MHAADNLATSCADCLEILWSSTSWNPKGLSRPVKGLLYRIFEVELLTTFIEHCYNSQMWECGTMEGIISISSTIDISFRSSDNAISIRCFCCVCTPPLSCVYVSAHILLPCRYSPLYLYMCPPASFCRACAYSYTVMYVPTHILVSLDFYLFLDLPTHLPVLTVACLSSNHVFAIVLIFYIACFL